MLNKLCILRPTSGCYQKVIKAIIVRETKCYYFVKAYNYEFNGEWKFSKKDNLRCGNDKEEFPRYKLTTDICIVCDGTGKYKSCNPDIKVSGTCQSCGGSGESCVNAFNIKL